MKLTERERLILIAGACIAVVIILVTPLARKWSRMGDELEPKLEYVAMLKDRVQGHDSLLSRRDALARRLGSLTGEAAEAEEGKPEEGEKDRTEEKKDKAAEAKGEDKEGKDAKDDGEAKANDEAKGNEDAKNDGKADEKGEANDKKDSDENEDAKDSVDAKSEGEVKESGDTKETVEPSEVDKNKGEDAADAEKSAEADEDGKKEQKEEGENGEKGAGASSEEEGKAKEGDEGKGEPGKKDESTEKADKADKEPEHVFLAAYVERVSQQAGMKMKRVSPKRVATGGKSAKSFTPTALQFSVEGNIRNLVKLLHALEKGDRFVRIEQIQLQRNIEQGGNVEASLDIMAYEAKAR